MNDIPDPVILTLREARQRAGIELETLAVMLKVPVRRLEALESGRYGDLPDLTFARALALSVCRTLKIEPQPILASIPLSAQVRLEEIERGSRDSLPQRPISLSIGTRPLFSRRLSVSMVLSGLMVVAAAVLWFALPQTPDDAASVSSMRTMTDTFAGNAGITVATPPAVDTVAVTPPANAAEAPPAPPATPPAQSQAAPTPPQSSAAQALLIRARQTTWVQVTGASNTVLLQRSLQPGESVSFNTDLPLAVVVGRADEMDVIVRGQVFNLAPHTRNNVARFEVR